MTCHSPIMDLNSARYCAQARSVEDVTCGWVCGTTEICFTEKGETRDYYVAIRGQ